MDQRRCVDDSSQIGAGAGSQSGVNCLHDVLDAWFVMLEKYDGVAFSACRAGVGPCIRS
jgi:hypothetical protein